MSVRKLKTLSKFQRRAYNNYVHVPEIKLERKWLEKLGFVPTVTGMDSEVMVKQQNCAELSRSKGKLTITPKKREIDPPKMN